MFSFAEDGIEALKRLKDDASVDIVLADINMPRMDGLVLLGELQKLDRLIKAVIISAYGDMDNIRTAMNRGAFDFITKPIDFEDLDLTLQKTYKEVLTLRQGRDLEQELAAIQRELAIASEIQLSALPSGFPAFPDRDEVDLHAMMIPAQEVGGDFFDFFSIDESRLGFLLGEVAGSGIGAALFMAITRTMLRSTALQTPAPAECLSAVNRVLYPESMAHVHVTVVYGVLNLNTGEVTYCNAGHYPPYLLRSGEQVNVLESPGGLGLCLTEEAAYEPQRAHLQPGDTMLIYSDGVTDAVSPSGELFADERLEQCVQDARGKAAAEIIRDVLRAIDRFTMGGRQADDITMLALQYRGKTNREPKGATHAKTGSP